MKHFIYYMTGTDPAPASGGDTKSWFMYYKWDVDGEAFVPFPESSLSKDVVVEPGDRLWFIMDGFPIGCVPILRTAPDPLNNAIEFHYDTRKMQEALHDRSHVVRTTTGLAENELAEQMQLVSARFDSMHPPRS